VFYNKFDGAGLDTMDTIFHDQFSKAKDSWRKTIKKQKTAAAIAVVRADEHVAIDVTAGNVFEADLI
jgi:hypothetical protein